MKAWPIATDGLLESVNTDTKTAAGLSSRRNLTGSDTPRRLKAFAAQFGAQPPWVFLTGTSASSSAIQEAFNVFRPDKMGHTPVTFIRRQPGEAWIRLDGIASAERILAEVRGVPGAWR